MFTIDISISLKCSAITLLCSGTSHIDFVPSALKQLLGGEKSAGNTRTRQKLLFCFQPLFRRLRSGRRSVTFPSSMGLSLMCTTGPGCVLVDLRHARNKKADMFTDQWSANKRDGEVDGCDASNMLLVGEEKKWQNICS